MAEPTSTVASLESPAEDARQTPATSTPTPPQPDVVTRQDFINAQKSWETRNRQLLENARRLEAQVEELSTRDMPDDERREYQSRKYIQQLEQRAAAAERAAAEYQEHVKVQQALGRIAVKTGVPLTELHPVWAQTQDADAVWEAAWEMKQANADRERKQEEREVRKSNNQVDTGSGRSSTTRTQWQAAIEAAEKTGDHAAYIRLLREEPSKK
jgi:vacuolar-type H+-ATPase catalytic subunit A/Vma1